MYTIGQVQFTQSLTAKVLSSKREIIFEKNYTQAGQWMKEVTCTLLLQA